MNNAAVDLPLVLGATAQLVCCVGLLRVRTTADRLHFASGAYSVGPFCVLAAVLVREQLSSIGLDSIAAVALLFLAAPVVVHATARAIRQIDTGDVGASRGDRE